MMFVTIRKASQADRGTGVLEMVKKAYFLGIMLSAACLVTAQDKLATLKPMDCTLIGTPSHQCDPLTFGKSLRSARTVAVVAIEAMPSWASVAARLDPSTPVDRYADLRDRYFHQFVEPRIPKGYSVSATYEEFRSLTEREKVYRKGALDRTTDQGDNPENKKLQKIAEALMRKWGRFTIVSDPELADLTLEVRRYAWFGFDTGEEQPVSFILVWAKHANPKKDDVIWLEKYLGSWKSSDTISGVFRDFRRSAEQAETLASAKVKRHS